MSEPNVNLLVGVDDDDVLLPELGDVLLSEPSLASLARSSLFSLLVVCLLPFRLPLGVESMGENAPPPGERPIDAKRVRGIWGGDCTGDTGGAGARRGVPLIDGKTEERLFGGGDWWRLLPPGVEC